MPIVTDAMVAEIIRRLPHKRIATRAYTRAELSSWVKNLAENLLYLDGSRRGVALAWEHHNVAHNRNLTGKQSPESDPPPGHDNQFRAAIAWVYRRCEAALKGHALPDLIQQTAEISLQKRFKDYNGRAQLPKVIAFYALEAARELRRQRKPDGSSVPPVLPSDDPFEDLDRYVRMGIIEEVDKHILIDSCFRMLSAREIVEIYTLRNADEVYKRKDIAHARIDVFHAIEDSYENGITQEEIFIKTDRATKIVESILKDFFKDIRIIVLRRDKYYLKEWDPSPIRHSTHTKEQES